MSGLEAAPGDDRPTAEAAAAGQQAGPADHHAHGAGRSIDR
jgi:hypothetical protein